MDDAEARVLRALEKYERHLNPAWVAGYKFAGLETLADRAEGAVITDAYGRDFIDFAAGPAVFILGHRHPRVVEAVKRELDRMPMSVRIMPDEPMADAAAVLAEASPGDLQRVIFTNSGAEANEAALKLARLYTGKPGLLAAEGAFHGKTFGALSVSGRELYRAPFQPLVPGVRHVPFGDVDAVAAAIREDTAAVILEPIQGENGVVVPPDGYLRAVREHCDRRGVLLILDEVQTGMGRTGRMWACDWEGVTPDIMTSAKGLAGGVTPLGAVVARDHVFQPLSRDPYLHSTTFGNRLGFVALIETIRVIQEEGLLARATAIGDRLRHGFRETQRGAPDLIKAVRGRGCLVGVEFTEPDVGMLVMAGLFARQVLGFQTLNKREVVRFAPPLVATDAQVDRAVEALAGATEEVRALLAEMGAESVPS